MKVKTALIRIGQGLLMVSAIAALAQGNRGNAQLKTQAGTVTIDYGRPSLKGRDMLSQLREGDFWRMGTNQASVIKLPADAAFGSTKVPKGDYSLWLSKQQGDKFVLVFNSQTGQWGTEHDPSKDVDKVALTKETLSAPVEIFTIDLKPAANGGVFEMSWGTTKLTANFQVGK